MVKGFDGDNEKGNARFSDFLIEDPSLREDADMRFYAKFPTGAGKLRDIPLGAPLLQMFDHVEHGNHRTGST
jgi:hypothetical protein